MKITVDLLKSHNACKEGLDAFILMFPDGFDLIDWTREKQIDLYRTELKRYIMWAVDENILPLWSMSGADLSRANLSGADLSGADLSGAILSRANLSGADLSRVDLSRAIGYNK